MQSRIESGIASAERDESLVVDAMRPRLRKRAGDRLLALRVEVQKPVAGNGERLHLTRREPLLNQRSVARSDASPTRR